MNDRTQNKNNKMEHLPFILGIPMITHLSGTAHSLIFLYCILFLSLTRMHTVEPAQATHSHDVTPL
jgi:hypothetical protein